MHGDELAVVQDAHLIGARFDLEHAPAGAVGNTVVVAANADAAFVVQAALDAQHRIEATDRQRQQMRALFGEVLGDDPIGGAVPAHIGYRAEPGAQLPVQIVDGGEAARQEEVGADVAVRALHLALGLGPIRRAGARGEAVVRCTAQQLGVVDDGLVGVSLAQHRCLHAVVQDLARHPAEVLERLHVTAQHRGQVLMQHELPPQIPAVTQHHGKQPHFALHLRRSGEADPELGEVDLRLRPRRRFESHLEHGCRRRAHAAQKVTQRGLAAGIAQVPDLSQQPRSGELRPRQQALAQIIPVRIDYRVPSDPRLVPRGHQPTPDVLAHRLAIMASALGNG